MRHFKTPAIRLKSNIIIKTIATFTTLAWRHVGRSAAGRIVRAPKCLIFGYPPILHAIPTIDI